MDKVAFIFPGQGSQFVGMGQEIAKNFSDDFSDEFSAIEQILGSSFLDIMWQDPKKELAITYNTQPALFIASAFASKIIKKRGLKPDYVAGHSLGEYSALYFSNVIDFKQGLELVRKRGELMNKAVPAGEGSMAAIIGLDVKKIEEICKAVGVDVANYNNEQQTVIAGKKELIIKAMGQLKQAGAKRAMELNVSGPFHSALMDSMVVDFKKEIDKTLFQKATIPIIANVNAREEIDPDIIKMNLLKQLFSSVQWLQTVSYLLDRGVKTFVEIGSGQVLIKLIKRIDSSVNLISVNNVDDLESMKSKLC